MSLREQLPDIDLELPAVRRSLGRVAVLWSNEGRSQDAIALGQTVDAMAPRTPTIVGMLAQVLFRARRLDEALQLIDDAIAQGIVDADLYTERAATLIARQPVDWMAVFQSYSSGDELDPHWIDHRFRDAMARFSRWYEDGLRKGEIDAGLLAHLAYFRGEHVPAAEHARKWAEGTSEPSAAVLRAKALYHLGRCDEAWEILQAAMRARPATVSEGARLSALCRARGSRPVDGLAEIDALLTKTPDDAELRYERAALLVGMGRLSEALVDFQRAFAVNTYWPAAAAHDARLNGLHTDERYYALLDRFMPR